MNQNSTVLPTDRQMLYLRGLSSEYIRAQEWWKKGLKNYKSIFDEADDIVMAGATSQEKCAIAIDYLKTKIGIINSGSDYAKAKTIPMSYAITDQVKNLLFKRGKELLKEDEWSYVLFGSRFSNQEESLKIEEMQSLVYEATDELVWRRLRGVVEIAELRKEEQIETNMPEQFDYHGRSGEQKNTLFFAVETEADRADDLKDYVGGLDELLWNINGARFDARTDEWRDDVEYEKYRMVVYENELEFTNGEFSVLIQDVDIKIPGSINCNYGIFGYPKNLSFASDASTPEERVLAYRAYVLENFDYYKEEIEKVFQVLIQEKTVTLNCFGSPRANHAEVIAQILINMAIDFS